MKRFNIKYVLFLLVLFLLYTFLCAYSYTSAVSSNISSSVFRLHVIANSDSQEDQNLKYLVRDALLKYMNEISATCVSKEEVINLADTQIDKFYEIAQNVILENGYDYTVQIDIENSYFPTKTYGDIHLPAGSYDALKVKIGNASGQNWWCVMFPPLCFVDVSSGIVPEESKKVMEDNLSEEEYLLVSKNNTEVKFKFKLIEWFQNNIITAKK